MRITKLFYPILFTFALFLGSSFESFGQQGNRDVTISAGFGVPELANIGVRFEWQQIQVGYSVGTNFIDDELMFSYSNDVYIHYAGFSELSSRRPYYLKLGVNYFWNETDLKLYEYLFFNTRLGREINITERFGIDISAGVSYELSHQNKLFIEPKNTWLERNFDLPMIPSFGVGAFYKL